MEFWGYLVITMTVCTLPNKVLVLIQNIGHALPGIHCHRYMYTTGSWRLMLQLPFVVRPLW